MTLRARMKRILPPALRRLLARLRRLGELRLHYRRDLHREVEIAALRRFFDHFGVDCVFDVGANAGQYARMLRAEVKFRGLIVSFEPIPSLAARLREMAAADPDWLVYDCALDAEAGEAAFNVMATAEFSSFSAPTDAETGIFAAMNAVSETITVTRRRLSDVHAEVAATLAFRRPFLKMDTQGHDLAVFRGGAEVIGGFVGLQSELSFRRIYAGAPLYHEAIELYRAQGFELSALFANTSGHFPELIEMDCLLYNRTAVAAQRSPG